MGYDVNYNSLDYADSRAICQLVYQRLQDVQEQLVHASMDAQRCQDDANLQCLAAGVGNRGYSMGILAEKLRTGYQHAVETVIEARRLEERVAAAINNYVSAESSIENRMLLATKETIWAEFLTELRTNNFRPPTQNMETMLNLLILSFLPRNPFAQSQPLRQTMHESTQDITKFLGKFGPSRNKEVVITEAGPIEKVEVDGSLGSFYELQKILNDAGPENDGQILIAKTKQDGHDVYLTILPGTQEDHDGKNPFDTYGIVDGFGIESENLVGPIIEALEISGAQEGDEVILSGYSQGGIHVANLMKNKFLKKKFKLKKMLTFGAPIGHIELPEDIRSLSIEDRKDMVPGADGTPNKRREDQITVIFDGPRIEQELPEGIFGKPHNLDIYGDHLQEINEHPHPELMENLREFSLPPGPLNIRRFQFERKDRPKNREIDLRKISIPDLRGDANKRFTPKPEGSD